MFARRLHNTTWGWTISGDLWHSGIWLYLLVFIGVCLYAAQFVNILLCLFVFLVEFTCICRYLLLVFQWFGRSGGRLPHRPAQKNYGNHNVFNDLGGGGRYFFIENPIICHYVDGVRGAGGPRFIENTTEHPCVCMVLAVLWAALAAQKSLKTIDFCAFSLSGEGSRAAFDFLKIQRFAWICMISAMGWAALAAQEALENRWVSKNFHCVGNGWGARAVPDSLKIIVCVVFCRTSRCAQKQINHNTKQHLYAWCSSFHSLLCATKTLVLCTGTPSYRSSYSCETLAIGNNIFAISTFLEVCGDPSNTSHLPTRQTTLQIITFSMIWNVRRGTLSLPTSKNIRNHCYFNDFGIGWGGPSPPVSSKNYENHNVFNNLGDGARPPATLHLRNKNKNFVYNVFWGGVGPSPPTSPKIGDQ